MVVSTDRGEQVFANGVEDAGFKHIEGEDRYTVIGHTNMLRALLVMWTDRKRLVRPITAREVGKRMREGYFRKRDREADWDHRTVRISRESFSGVLQEVLGVSKSAAWRILR